MSWILCDKINIQFGNPLLKKQIRITNVVLFSFCPNVIYPAYIYMLRMTETEAERERKTSWSRTLWKRSWEWQLPHMVVGHGSTLSLRYCGQYTLRKAEQALKSSYAERNDDSSLGQGHHEVTDSRANTWHLYLPLVLSPLLWVSHLLQAVHRQAIPAKCLSKH